MVDRWVRLSADQSVAPERVEVQRKPLGESQVLLFGEEEGCFRLIQGVLIDVSGVREHVLFGGWPEACDERLIRLRHQRQEYRGDHTEQDGHERRLYGDLSG